MRKIKKIKPTPIKPTSTRTTFHKFQNSYNISRMANFEIDGTRFLLTWPQSNGLDFRDIERILSEIGKIKYAVIAHEYHQDGGDHFHAVVLYEKE